MAEQGGITMRHLRSSFLLVVLAALSVACSSSRAAQSSDVVSRRASRARTFTPSAAPTDERWLRTPPPAMPMRELDSLPVVERKLANGLRVLVAERHDFPSIGLAFVLQRGVCDGGGAAELYVRAFGGSPGHSQDDNFSYLRYVAALPDRELTEDSFIVAVNVLPPLLHSVVSRLGPMVLGSELASGDLEYARRSLKNVLATEAATSKSRHARRALRESLFGAGAYGAVVVDPSEVDAISDARIREFRAAASSPSHVTVVAVGDTTPDAIVALLERYTGKFARTEPRPSSCADVAARSPSSGIVLIDDPDAVQSTVIVGAVGVAAGHEDGPALDVLASSLGASLSSRLSLKIRQEHGDTYGVRMASRRWRSRGLVELSTSVESSRTAEVVRGLFAELDRAAVDVLDDEELSRAKGEAIEGGGTHLDVVGALLETATYGQPVDALMQHAHAVANVTRDDVTRVAETYLASPRRVVVIVGNAALIAPSLEGLGLGRVVVQRPQGGEPRR